MPRRGKRSKPLDFCDPLKKKPKVEQTCSRMISIFFPYVLDILNGKKKIENRKKRIPENTWIVIQITKVKPKSHLDKFSWKGTKQEYKKLKTEWKKNEKLLAVVCKFRKIEDYATAKKIDPTAIKGMNWYQILNIHDIRKNNWRCDGQVGCTKLAHREMELYNDGYEWKKRSVEAPVKEKKKKNNLY